MVARIGAKRPPRNYLRAWRDRRGLTQEQLAERLGTSKGQISRWESLKRDMSAKVQTALAEALAIEPHQIFRDPTAPSVDELLAKATPEQRKLAVGLIEALLKAS